MTDENESAAPIEVGEPLANDSTALARPGTGPRTTKGKQRSRYNALKHGIFSKVVVLENEPRAEFNALLQGWLNVLQPQGEFEEFLVEKLAALAWRHRRLIIAEGKNIESLEIGTLIDPEGPSRTADHLVRYEASNERAFDRTLSQLERAQRMRLGQPVPPPIKLDISSDRETHPEE